MLVFRGWVNSGSRPLAKSVCNFLVQGVHVCVRMLRSALRYLKYFIAKARASPADHVGKSQQTMSRRPYWEQPADHVGNSPQTILGTARRPRCKSPAGRVGKNRRPTRRPPPHDTTLRHDNPPADPKHTPKIHPKTHPSTPENHTTQKWKNAPRHQATQFRIRRRISPTLPSQIAECKC